MACSPVMKSRQASLFGFPNPLIGIAAFAVVVTLGVVVLWVELLAQWVGRAADRDSAGPGSSCCG